MFYTDYTFKGKHANIVTQLTAEIDSETKFKLFNRNIDVLIIAPIIGLLYGVTDTRDDSGQVIVENIKKINYQQMSSESYILNYNYTLVMLLHDKNKVSIEERLNRAFKYTKGSPEREECDKIFESYVLGGINKLKEKLLDGAVQVDDYINNIFNFISEYDERYNKDIKEEDIINMCTNN